MEAVGRFRAEDRLRCVPARRIYRSRTAPLRAIMRAQIEAAGLDELAGEFEQGFIDQFGRFYDRTAALAVVQFSGQPFNADRNWGSGKLLFSEGLY